MLTVLGPSLDSSSTNVTNTHSASRSMICLITSLPTTSASRSVVEPKLSFMISTLVRRRLLEDLVDAEQLVLELPAQCLDILLALEMGEDPIGEEQPDVRSGNGKPKAGEVVELTKRPRKRGLAAVVRAAHDQDPLGIREVKVVAHHRPAVACQLRRQREVERFGGRRHPSSEPTLAGGRCEARLPSAARCTRDRRGRTGPHGRSGRSSGRDSARCRVQYCSSLENVSG